MSKLIFCKFLDMNGKPRGRDYTYRTDIDVQQGDYVLVEVVNSSFAAVQKPGYESFKDKIKTIIGSATSDENPEKADDSEDEDIPVINIEDL